MADFLTRLAERTLRTVPVAQPIITSMFAPQQFMTAPMQETESWSTAGAAPVQDAARAQRAKTDSVTATQGEPDNHVSLHQEQEVLVEANRLVGDRVDTNQPGTNPTSTSPIQLANDAKSTMRQGGPPPNAMPSGGWNAPDSLLYTDGSSFQSGYTRGDSLQQGVQETSSPRSGLPVPQTGFPIFAEQPDEQDPIGARLIVPSVPSPQPIVTNQLSTATGHLPEEADTSEMAAQELIRAPQARALRLAPASGMTSRQGEPVALEREEAVSPQPVVERNSIVPLASAERVGTSLKRETSFNPLVEETFDSIVATHSQTTSAINSTASYIHPRIGKEVTEQEQFNTASPRNQDDRKGSPLLHTAATPETYTVGAPLAGALPRPAGILPGPASPLHTAATPETYPVGAPLAGALPGLSRPAGALPGPPPALHAATPETYPVGAPLAGALIEGGPAPALHDQGRPQPSSPLRTIGQVDVLPVEQHLLVSQVQLPHETAPQQQTDAPLINIFTPGLRRNQSQSRSSLAQHDQASIRQDPVLQDREMYPVGAPLAGALVEGGPSIHITIGRIDVRAVTSPVPAPPSKPARPSPLLSLDDYLKQGKGAGQ